MTKLTSSIAMCTYNGEKYLQEQLDSLAAQTRLPDELVVCDDCSSDGTVALLEQFANLSNFPVRIYKNENRLGYGKNFEKASRLCKKEVIFFCDQDDIWLPHKIYEFMKVFENNQDVGLVMSEAELVDKEKTLLNILLSERNNIPSAIIPRLVESNPSLFALRYYVTWTGMVTAFRSNLLKYALPFSKYNYHDLWIVRVLGAITSARFLSEPTVLYRIHGFNTSGSEIVTHDIRTCITQACQPGLADYYHQVSDVMEELVIHLKGISDNVRFPDTIRNFAQKGKHYKERYWIHKGKKKYWRILIETLNGNYFRYSRGILSILSDIIS